MTKLDAKLTTLNCVCFTVTSSSSAVTLKSCPQWLCAAVRLQEEGCTTPAAKGTTVCKVLFCRREDLWALSSAIIRLPSHSFWGLYVLSVVHCTVWKRAAFSVKQVFGGGVQENSLFFVARKPDRLQSRFLVLRHLENHAKFQVWERRFLSSSPQMHLVTHSPDWCLYTSVIQSFLVWQRLSTTGCPRIHALLAGPSPQGASVQPQRGVSPSPSSGRSQTLVCWGKMLHVSQSDLSDFLFVFGDCKSLFMLQTWEYLVNKAALCFWIFTETELPVSSRLFLGACFKTRWTAWSVERNHGSLIHFLVRHLTANIYIYILRSLHGLSLCLPLFFPLLRPCKCYVYSCEWHWRMFFLFPVWTQICPWTFPVSSDKREAKTRSQTQHAPCVVVFPNSFFFFLPVFLFIL